MNITYNTIFKNIIPFVSVILLAYFIANILYYVLPKDKPSQSLNINNALEYKRFNISAVFKETKVIEKQNLKVNKKQEYALLKNIELIAIYSMSDNSGYIVLKENNKNNTVLLSSGEKFKQYTLSEVYASYVIFTNKNKEYKVEMSSKEEIKYKISSVNENIQTTKEIQLDEDHVTIKRTLVNNYIKNFDKIWEDVAISELRTKNGIDGFKINRIKKNSPFSKIGIKKGDIIKSINNVELKSYNDAFKIYKKINKIKDLNIKLLRDNTEMEIFYEIK